MFNRRTIIYAVVESGGKQYRVAPGQIIRVERLAVNQGDKVQLRNVLLVSGDDGALIAGSPTIKGATVVAEALGEDRDDKITVFKYKNKVRYRRKLGHHQVRTRLAIKKILVRNQPAISS